MASKTATFRALIWWDQKEQYQTSISGLQNVLFIAVKDRMLENFLSF